MIPYTTLDSIIAQMPERTGHTLLDEDQGCVNGCRMGVSLYRSTEYHMPQKHDDQEGFYWTEKDMLSSVAKKSLCCPVPPLWYRLTRIM